MVDPGHGGNDPGAVGPTGFYEKYAALDISLRARRYMEETGEIKVKLTRDSDIRLGNDERQDINKRVQLANNSGADVFVSIHTNSFNNQAANGIETWYHRGSEKGKEMALMVQDSLIRTTGLLSRGTKETSSNFEIGVLKYTNMPAILVEVGFISNPAEEALLKSEAFRDSVARAIADGVISFLGVKKPNNGLFLDVGKDHWAVESIERLAKLGIMAGHEDGTFRPDESVGRAQVAVIVDRALKMLGR